MEFGFAEKVLILGEEYGIEIKDEDPGFKGEHVGANGYTDYAKKRIVLRDKSGWPAYKDCSEELKIMSKKTLRHEIVHAFLFESGLSGSTTCGKPWARNEEMIDWMAIQGPKFVKAWQDAGAL